MGPVLFSALVHLPAFCRQGLLYVTLYVMIQFLLRRMDLKDIITGVVNQLCFFSYLINSFQFNTQLLSLYSVRERYQGLSRTIRERRKKGRGRETEGDNMKDRYLVFAYHSGDYIRGMRRERQSIWFINKPIMCTMLFSRKVKLRTQKTRFIYTFRYIRHNINSIIIRGIHS